MDLSCISDILNLKLPLLLRNSVVPEWFKVKIREVAKSNLAVGLKYTVSLPVPYTDKLRYYDLIISNCVIDYYNQFLNSFDDSKSIEHKKFLVDRYLDREVVQRIKDTAEAIIERELHWERHNDPNYKDQREVIFILNAMKYQLLWLYMEIKNTVEQTVIKDYENIESLLAGHFFEYSSECPFISEN
jgi:hypothetical protein